MDEPAVVAFVCLHASAKSLIAAECFNRLAAERGLEMQATTSGPEPDAEVPANVTSGLLARGIDARGRHPARVTAAALAGAQHIVSFGCDISGLVPAKLSIERWDDCPAVSEDFDTAWNYITTRVAVLVERQDAARRGALLLTRSDIAATLDQKDCIVAVEEALRLHAAGCSYPPAVLSMHAKDGGIHVKASGLQRERPYFAVKANANFPGNPGRFGLPTIQGVVMLFDGEQGLPLALLDSGEITARRTAAASAVAAKYLAQPDASVVTLFGCGKQAPAQLAALKAVRPIRRVYVHDIIPDIAKGFAKEQSETLGVEVTVAGDAAAVVSKSHIVVTCTSSRVPIVKCDWVRPGCFLAAVGADSPDKQELEPSLLKRGRLVVDHRRQCAEFGELHHGIEAGLGGEELAYAELHEIVAGKVGGRTAADEIFIFDSTGTALLDVAAAVAVFSRAVRLPEVRRLSLTR